MSSGGPGFDQTEWSGLLKSAQGGKLTLLNVDEKALGVLTAACENFISDIMGLVKAVGENVPELEWTYNNKPDQPDSEQRETTLSSMKLLWERFDRKRLVELVDVLKNHQAIVTVMGETFEEAGKAYRRVDVENGNTFDVPGEAKTTDHWPVIWREHSFTPKSWKDGPTTGAGSGAGFDTSLKGVMDAVLENGDNLTVLDFANIAAILAKNGGNSFWIAGEWNAYAKVWHTSVDKFTKAVDYVFKNQYWQGVGADRAVAFLDKYLKSTTGLFQGMVAMSNVIGNTANLNAYVYSRMYRYDQLTFGDDGTVTAVSGASSVNGALSALRTFWDKGDGESNQKGYRGGVLQLVGWIPSFADPNKLAGANGDLPGTYNYRQPTGDNNGGGNKGGGGKSGEGSGGGKSGEGSGGGKSGEGSGGGKSGEGSGGGKGAATGAGGGKQGSGTGDGTGSGTGSGGGQSGGGSGGAGNPTGNPGPATGPAGPSGPIGIGGGGASGGQSSADLMRMFSEVLQLISSGIPTLVQLGNQLAAQLGPGLQALAKAVENGTMTVKQALDEASERIEWQVRAFRQDIEEQLFPPGATGPVGVSFGLLPGGVPQVRLDFPGRAGGHQPEVFQDFTATRSTTEVAGESATTGNPGSTVEENR